MGGGALRLCPALTARKPQRLRHHRAVQEMGGCHRIKRAQTVCSDQRGQFLNDDREAALHQDIHRPCAHHRRGVAKEDAGVFRPQRKVKIGVIAGG